MIQDLSHAHKINGIRAIAIEMSVHGWDLVKLLAEILGVEDVCDVGEDVLKEVG